MQELDGTFAELKQLVANTPEVTPSRRLAMLAVTALFPFFLTMILCTNLFFLRSPKYSHSKLDELYECVSYLEGTALMTSEQKQIVRAKKPSNAVRESFEIYIVGNHRNTIADRKTWNTRKGLFIPAAQRAFAERLIAERPRPTSAELAEASAIVKPILNKVFCLATLVHKVPLTAILNIIPGIVMMIWFFFLTIPGMITAISFRLALIMWLFGVTCVDSSGAPVSRARMFWRTLIFHSPVYTSTCLTMFVLPYFLHPTSQARFAFNIAILGVVLWLIVWSSIQPVRGLTDRLAGTYLVPK